MIIVVADVITSGMSKILLLHPSLILSNCCSLNVCKHLQC